MVRHPQHVSSKSFQNLSPLRWGTFSRQAFTALTFLAVFEVDSFPTTIRFFEKFEKVTRIVPQHMTGMSQTLVLTFFKWQSDHFLVLVNTHNKVWKGLNLWRHELCTLYIRPGEKLWKVTPQTPLNFLGQNLIRDPFWRRSKAREVYPQAILGPGHQPPRSWTWSLRSPQKLVSDCGLKNWMEFEAWLSKKIWQA